MLKLRSVTVRNFRGYSEEVRIPIEDLTAFVGRNDSGKSSILDALAIFFESPLCKLEPEDSCISASEDDQIEIGCEFEELPESVVLDKTSATSLADEFLLTDEGTLEIRKSWKIGATSRTKPRIFVRAVHPTSSPASDLIGLKNSELKRLADDLGTEVDDRRSNPTLRKAIRAACVDDLCLTQRLVELDAEDGKKVWEQIHMLLPTFALFRADRPSTDGDAEVQDPLRVAVDMAVSELADELEAIKEAVKVKAIDVALRTMAQLEQLSPDLAETLNPDFSKEPGWAGLFKIGLSDDLGVPINKRGSGVRRLVLLSFLRAEAERQREASEGSGVIYAIEEPETAQHPSNQRLVVRALQDLALADETQVLVTTHVPALVAELPTSAIRHVVRVDGQPQVDYASDETMEAVVSDLGVLGRRARASVLVCVEGPTDAVALEGLATVLKNAGRTGLDLRNDPNIAVVPLGGSTLIHWATRNYLQGFRVPEVHIYDRDQQPPEPAKYQSAANAINERDDASIAFITDKREIENYLHPQAIVQAFSTQGVDVDCPEVDDWCDVEGKLKEVLDGQSRVRRKTLKTWCAEAAAHMTDDLLAERGATEELESWLAAIEERLSEGLE